MILNPTEVARFARDRNQETIEAIAKERTARQRQDNTKAQSASEKAPFLRLLNLFGSDGKQRNFRQASQS